MAAHSAAWWAASTVLTSVVSMDVMMVVWWAEQKAALKAVISVAGKAALMVAHLAASSAVCWVEWKDGKWADSRVASMVVHSAESSVDCSVVLMDVILAVVMVGSTAGQLVADLAVVSVAD